MASSSNEPCSDNEVTSLAQANNYLAVTLYKLLAEEKQNVFFSPFSISTALAMLFCGAREETAEEMKKVLGYEHASIEDESVVTSFQKVLAAVDEGADSYILNYANSLLSQKDFVIKDEFKSVLNDAFKALMMEVDFVNESDKVVHHINEWVKEKTNDMIPHFLDSLDLDTVIVIINAVYFKGTWLHQFEEKSTFLQYFYNQGDEENAKQVDMMHQKETFPFVEKESFKALQLPYKGENIAMLILLPHSKNGLEDLEGSLGPTFIQDLKAEMKKTKVEVAFPKFKLEYSKSLKGSFGSMGMNRIFQRGADLSGISDSKNLEVSEIFHKAVLEVNEVGSEAAAVTAIMVRMMCLTYDPEFVVDHPFAFIIYDTRSDLILFMGRVDEL